MFRVDIRKSSRGRAKLAGAADGVGGRQIFFGGQGQVVVLDEDGVEQAGAMVVAAAAADGVLFQPPPAGRGFARVVDARAGAFDAADVLARERGDAGEAAEKIQQRPLAGEHVAGRTGELGDDRAGRDFVAIARARAQLDRGLHFVDHNRHRPQAGDDARFAGDDRRPALAVRTNEGDGRPIVLPVEVFAHGEPDELTQIVFDRERPIRVVEIP